MEEARLASGIQQIYWEENFETVLPSLMAYCESVYVNINENDRLANFVPYKDIRFAHKIREEYPAHELKRLGPIM